MYLNELKDIFKTESIKMSLMIFRKNKNEMIGGKVFEKKSRA